MFRITVEKGFTAAHQLTLPDGTKEQLHSHDWLVRVTVAARNLDKMGLVMDFERLGGMIDEIARPFAGRKLEEFTCFAGVNTSAENVARYIFGQVQPMLEKRARLESVEVMETPGCWADYGL